MSERIIVALDGMSKEEALRLADRLRGSVWGFKVNDLLVQCGLEIVTALKKRGRVFADPKLYDIPNTVSNSVAALAGAGADLITVHVSGGKKMLTAAAKAAGSAKVLGVTILTSFDDASCKEVYQRETGPVVRDFLAIAAETGTHGVVCSPKELEDARKFPSLMKVIPGVRPEWHTKADDQTRTLTPKQTLANGADLLVIGRPITEHADPLEAVRLINEELR